MKTKDLTRRLADRAHIPRPEAKDKIENVVAGIVRSLKKGREVKIPGLGKLRSK